MATNSSVSHNESESLISRNRTRKSTDLPTSGTQLLRLMVMYAVYNSEKYKTLKAIMISQDE